MCIRLDAQISSNMPALTSRWLDILYIGARADIPKFLSSFVEVFHCPKIYRAYCDLCAERSYINLFCIGSIVIYKRATRRLRTLSVHCSVQTDVSIMLPDSENLVSVPKQEFLFKYLKTRISHYIKQGTKVLTKFHDKQYFLCWFPQEVTILLSNENYDLVRKQHKADHD